MTDDPRALRRDIAQLAEGPHESLLEEASARGLVMAFNKLAGPGRGIHTAAEVALEIRTGEELTARAVADVLVGFSRAVAAVGREIEAPATQTFRLTQADYRKTLLVSDGIGAHLVRVKPERFPLLMDEEPVPNRAAAAMDRLTGLLPIDAQDRRVLDALIGTRTPSRRAVREVAAVAARFQGLTLRLFGLREAPVGATVTQSQAREILDLLDVQECSVRTETLVGTLDGARERRRIFYLELDDERTLTGTIDEALLDEAFSLLRARVFATLEVTALRKSDGSTGRDGYRLTGLQPELTLGGASSPRPQAD